jgi:cytochrome c5
VSVVRLLLALALLAGCPSLKAGPPPGRLSASAVIAAQQRFPGATEESLEAGRQSFLRTCNRCHAFPAIGGYSEAQWQQILPRMTGKANLDATQSQQLVQFVLAARAPDPAFAR